MRQRRRQTLERGPVDQKKTHTNQQIWSATAAEKKCDGKLRQIEQARQQTNMQATNRVSIEQESKKWLMIYVSIKNRTHRNVIKSGRFFSPLALCLARRSNECFSLSRVENNFKVACTFCTRTIIIIIKSPCTNPDYHRNMFRTINLLACNIIKKLSVIEWVESVHL